MRNSEIRLLSFRLAEMSNCKSSQSPYFVSGGVSLQSMPFNHHWIVLFLLSLFIGDGLMLVSHHEHAIFRISQSVWRAKALQHRKRISELLQPGLISTTASQQISNDSRQTLSLDPKHPIYNFLIEYYGLKGTKGVRKLARWSPGHHPLKDHSAILLEGAHEEDFGDILHARGAYVTPEGILYHPARYFKEKSASPFTWNRRVLHRTLVSDPVLHCYGLHEWAMQYQPRGADPPPSAKYQAHLPLRVSRDTINSVVERKGVHCTHVDALRYFAPAAAPFNCHGCPLPRQKQVELEQPACVHATMDLLKFALRLSPFVDDNLLQQALEVALMARRLDVAASPYDASSYHLMAIPVETPEGRAQYKQQQHLLLQTSLPVRTQVLDAYDVFLQAAFASEAREEKVLLTARESTLQ